MTTTRLFASVSAIRSALVLTCLLCSTLCGCGGGSGTPTATSRSVTITVRWPASVAKAIQTTTTRATIAATQGMGIEVFDGTTRVAHKWITYNGQVSTSALTLALPAKALTFYANGFATTIDPGFETNGSGYKTDVTTGLLTVNGQAIPVSNSGASDAPDQNHPVSHAVTVADIAVSSSVTFTLNNTIATLEPRNDPAASPTPGASSTVVVLGSSPISIADRIRAKSADGAVVLLATTASPLTAQIDPTDTLGSLRATITQTAGQSPVLVPNATGTVKVIVYDNEVNTPGNQGNQQPIQARITFTITSTILKTLPLDLTNLALTVPPYAKSVTYTLAQNPLTATTGAAPLTEDSVPPLFTSGRYSVTPTNNAAGTAVASVTLQALDPPAKYQYNFTGRDLTLIVRAWSNADGTGTVLADNQTGPATNRIGVTIPKPNVDSTVQAALALIEASSGVTFE